MGRLQDARETVYEHISGCDGVTVTTSEIKEIRKFKKLCAKYPEHIKIICTNADGSLLVHIPYSWLTVRPKKQTPAARAENFKSSQ